MDFKIENGVLLNYFGESKEVVIPDGVTQIGAMAFYYKKIEKVIIPEGVSVIGEDAFRGCSMLDGIVLPESLVEIKKCAFYGCSKIKNINFPKNLRMIHTMAFGFTGIKNVIIPETVEYFSSDAFHMLCHPFYTNESKEEFLQKTDSGLSPVYCVCLKKGVLEKYTFYHMFDQEEEIYIPHGVKGIGNTAFDSAVIRPNFGRWDAKKIYLPESVKQIGKLTFNKCKDIIICARKGSYAEKYAAERGLIFEETDY